MSPWQVIRLAVRALLRAPLRALLTLLGIVIGIGAVLAMVALGEGTRAGVQAQLASLGSNLVVVYPGAMMTRGVRSPSGSRDSLKLEDAYALASLPGVRYAAPVARGNAQLVFGPRNWATSVLGTTPEYLAVREWSVEEGSFFGPSEVRSGASVCVLGATTARELFGGMPAVGQQIRVNKMTCEVIGVLTAKGQSSQGQDQDDILLLPITTFRTRIQPSPTNSVSMIILTAASPDASAALVEEARALLRQQHRLGPNEEDDFTIQDIKEVAQAMEQQTAIFSLLLGGIASISLLVGGIGIMNIMLVSVTERTREIGIRMAVGARGRDILAQFLTESLLLALVGGVLGIGLGIAAAKILERIMEWPTAISPEMMLLAALVAGGVGVVFGLAPAWKASRLDPIEALRHE